MTRINDRILDTYQIFVDNYCLNQINLIKVYFSNLNKI